MRCNTTGAIENIKGFKNIAGASSWLRLFGVAKFKTPIAGVPNGAASAALLARPSKASLSSQKRTERFCGFHGGGALRCSCGGRVDKDNIATSGAARSNSSGNSFSSHKAN